MNVEGKAGVVVEGFPREQLDLRRQGACRHTAG
jgi:hypothetical protein